MQKLDLNSPQKTIYGPKLVQQQFKTVAFPYCMCLKPAFNIIMWSVCNWDNKWSFVGYLGPIFVFWHKTQLYLTKIGFLDTKSVKIQ